MWYVVGRLRLPFFALPLLFVFLGNGCSLRILGVDKNTLTSEATSTDGGSSSEISTFSVLGATGGTDVTADSYLSDGDTLTAQWVDTTGEDSYQIQILDSTGSTTLCGPVSAPAETTSYTLSGCSLSHGVTYRIQVTAKNSTSLATQSAYANFQVGPFITVGDTIVDETGVASIPVTLSYPALSPVTLSYVTADSTAQSASDFAHRSLASLIIPAGETSAKIPVPLFSDRTIESDENFRVELVSASGAGILDTSALVTIQNDDYAPLSGATQLSAGGGHACALTSSGSALCWGAGLAFGSATDTDLPAQVAGLSSGVTQVEAGYMHTCVLTSSGGVRCLGYNGMGALGDNSTTDRATPVDVVGLTSGVSQISAGGFHTCALTTAGALKCWGGNFYGQLGNSSMSASAVPVNVTSLSSGVIQVVAGDTHTCALTSAGAVKCWGWNFYGQLGDNTYADRSAPVQVSGLTSGITQIGVGSDFSCALSSSGAVSCWGRNLNGRLGDNTTFAKIVPNPVSGLSSGVTQIGVGTFHSCALTSAGALKCWGENTAGSIGDGTLTHRLVPTDVTGISGGISQIASGRDYSCALSSSGSARCWGNNLFGQLGIHTATGNKTPVDPFAPGSEITQIEGGNLHTCAITQAGGLKCWGNNYYGQLGDNSTTYRTSPVDVSGLSADVTQVAIGSQHSCALSSSGAVSCWGDNSVRQLGDNTITSRSVAAQVFGLPSGVSQIDSGAFHICALLSTGGVKCWGSNFYGQLGDNSTTDRSVPVDVIGLTSGVARISIGSYHSCAQLTSGAVKCWGGNYAGQLGNNSTTDSSVPIDTLGLGSGVTRIDMGGTLSCAILSDSSLKCWGDNFYGQLGDNSHTNRIVPTAVSGLSSGVTQVSPGDDHTCALLASGALRCWGRNDRAQIGLSSSSDQLVPAEVAKLTSGVTAVSAGGKHTCAITLGGSAKCWGSNSSGQLGDSLSEWVPQTVLAP